jgi:enoyl-CoA hydratase/carnithine racemase
MADEILFQRAAGIVTLTINQPDNKNMLTDRALELLDRYFLELEGDSSVRVAVLTGSGSEYFCGGLFNPKLKGRLSFEEVRSIRRRAIELFARIENLMHPVVAAINGRAQAGGCELALACDMRICASHGVFNLPETSWGGFPGAGGPMRLARLVGPGKAMEVIMTGRDVNSEEALRTGLVECVFPSDVFESETHRLVGQISSTSPLGNRAVKKLVRASAELGDSRIQSLSESLRDFVGSSDDALEGRAAYLEGRPPVYKAR